MITLEKFNSMYKVHGMNRNSLTLINNQTNEMVFIHRNAYNVVLHNACEDIREVERTFEHGRSCKWVEVLTWVSI
jgi:hypothetical protein